MKTANDGKGETKYGARIIAFFLLAGGLLGLVGSLLALYHCAQQRLLAGISGILSTVLFGWCVLTGAALWRITPDTKAKGRFDEVEFTGTGRRRLSHNPDPIDPRV